MDFKPKYLKEEKKSGADNLQTEGGKTFLKTGEFQSPNFRTGQIGWKIDSNGNAEFQNITIEGGTIGGWAVEADQFSSADFFLGPAGFNMLGGSFEGDIRIATGSSNSLLFGGTFLSPDMSITCDEGTDQLDVSG